MSRIRKLRRMGIAILLVLALLAAGVAIFVNRSNFGRLPHGERLERIRKSPNYRDGEFRNRQQTTLMTTQKGRIGAFAEFLFREKKGLRPDGPIHVIKTDLKVLPSDGSWLVWFGHSSYLFQLGGKRFLVDPVFCAAAPLGFLNKPFAGTDIYKPEDMPAVDFLVITHDHWDHLDYETVMVLKDRIGRVVCPLGVGEHFERWGFGPEQLIELDWDEDAVPLENLTIHCLPARHFSGRGLRANQALWASYLVATVDGSVYIGGDSGYGEHFAAIGRKFPGIDLAILENGQYNAAWRNIHTMPEYLPAAAQDLGAKRVLTVHHSKYALAKHRWDEPLANARKLSEVDSLEVLMPRIGEPVNLNLHD